MAASEHKPVLIVIAGPNGSGKTSVTSKILQHEWLEDSEYKQRQSNRHHPFELDVSDSTERDSESLSFGIECPPLMHMRTDFEIA